MSFFQSLHLDIREIEVVERVDDSEYTQDYSKRLRDVAESTGKQAQAEIHTEVKKYHWALFLASFFAGMAFTALVDYPVGIFLGMCVGFLCFVEPIYQRIIRLLS